MASYFRQVPDFDYVNRDSDGKNIGDYQVVKNLFKRVKIRQDILENIAYFTQYQIVGDDRPDNVAFEIQRADARRVYQLVVDTQNLKPELRKKDEKAVTYLNGES